MDGVLASLPVVDATQVWIALACVSATYLTGRFFKRWADMDYIVGYKPIFAPLSTGGAIFPTTFWNLGLTWYWDIKKTSYFNKQHDIITIIPILSGAPTYYVGSLDVAKQILASENQTLLEKPREWSPLFLMWGDNLFSSNDEMWKRHRRIISPAFNPKMYSYVVEQTTSIYKEMVDCEGWLGKKSADISNITHVVQRSAFLVISRCGFGMNSKWDTPEGEALEHTETYAQEALTAVLDSPILRLVLPSWAWKLPFEKLQKLDYAWKFIAKFMKDSVRSRKDDINNDPTFVDSRQDFFTKIVASSIGVGKNTLSEDEVIGNTFLLMFAGHETTGMALAETLAFLAIYQDEQDKAYEEIKRVLGTRDPESDDLGRLTHTVSCFLESARIYPPGPTLLRRPAKDLVVNVQHPTPGTVILKKDIAIAIDMITCHHNPHTFTDPEKYDPSRWYDVPEVQVSMFGHGPRGCLGRKFAHIEAMTFLSLFLRDWKVDPILEAGESNAQWRERVMGKASLVGFTFGVSSKIPLRISPRKK